MYEVNDHQKTLENITEILKKEVDQNEIEGIIILKVFKNNDVEVVSELGRMTPYEWIGMLDFTADVVKGGYSQWLR